MDHPQVMLVGSANMDLVVRTPRFPSPGETLIGLGFQTFAGGKGANQAAAIGKLGGKCSLLAKVGKDSFGQALIASLIQAGVNTENVIEDPHEATGVAIITVDQSGQNTIVVAPGTNALLTPEEVQVGFLDATFDVVLAQLEIPLEAVLAASQFSDARKFILNPAPARDLPNELLQRVDYLTPNETETQILTGIYPSDPTSCREAAQVLLRKGVKNVLITLGAKGSYLCNIEGEKHFPSIKVQPVDTTAAGDAFNGAFAWFLASGKPVFDAIRLANITGALCTTKMGAQASMPSLSEVQAWF